MGMDNIVTDLSIIMWITQNMKIFVTMWISGYKVFTMLSTGAKEHAIGARHRFSQTHTPYFFYYVLYPTIKNSNSKEYRNLIYIIQLKNYFYLRLSQKYRIRHFEFY